MSFEFRVSGFRSGWLKGFYLLLFTFYLLLCSCGVSVPNLEEPQCTEARNAVKRFYSFHFDNDMHPSLEYLELRDRFLTRNFRFMLGKGIGGLPPPPPRDYFTATENYPKAFRVGECKLGSGTEASLQVLLLWRDDTSSDQKEVHVDMVKVDDAWLINGISN